MADTDTGTVVPPTIPPPGVPPTIPPGALPGGIRLKSIPNVVIQGVDPVIATPQSMLPQLVTPPTTTPPTTTPVATPPDTRISLSDPGPGWSAPGQFVTPASYAPPNQPPTTGAVSSYWSTNQPIRPNLAQTASDPRGLIPTIVQAATAYGIDPNTAIAVAQSEGLTNFLGDDGTSGGAFQLHIGGGMGDEFRRDTGLDPLNPAYERQGIWYAMKRASQEGWGAFHGAANTGVGEWQGIRNNQRYVSAQSTPGLAYREPGQWGREPQEGWGTLPRQPMDFDAFMVKARKMAPFLSGNSMFTQAYMVRAYDAYLKAFQGNQLEAMKYRSAEWQQHMQEMSDQLAIENKDIGDAMASNTGNAGQQMDAVRDLAIKYDDKPLQIAADHGADAVTALMQARDHFGSDTTKTSAALQTAQEKKKEDDAIEAEAQNNLAMWKADPANANATPQQVQAKLWELRMKARHEMLDKPDKPDKPKTEDPGKKEDREALDAAVEQDVQDKTAEYKAAHNGQDPSPGQVAQFRQDARKAREAKPSTAKPGDPGKQAEYNAAVARTKEWAEKQTPPVTEGSDAWNAHLGEEISAQKRSGQKPASDGLETSKTLEVLDPQNHVVRTVLARERRNQTGWVDSQTGEPIKLEPGQTLKEVTPTSASGGRAGAQVSRQIIAGREVLSDLQNMSRLPVGTTTGVLGQYVPGVSLYGALRGDLARKFTDQDAQLMQASAASIQRELSVLMSPVYGGRYASEQIEPLIPKAGDSMGTVMFKLARLRQTAENALDGLMTSPTVSNDERELASDTKKNIQEAIPWTTDQARDFAHRGKAKESFGDFVKRGGIEAPSATTPPPPRTGWSITPVP